MSQKLNSFPSVMSAEHASKDSFVAQGNPAHCLNSASTTIASSRKRKENKTKKKHVRVRLKQDTSWRYFASNTIPCRMCSVQSVAFSARPRKIKHFPCSSVGNYNTKVQTMFMCLLKYMNLCIPLRIAMGIQFVRGLQVSKGTWMSAALEWQIFMIEISKLCGV